ncbi:MAG: DNA topoisomerase IB [Sulfuriferula sp.]
MPDFHALAVTPTAEVRASGLRYVTDQSPGLRRAGRPSAFWYVDADNHKIDDPATLARIAKLAIPPAWTEVWIAASAKAHLQATGRDVRGRKQYRYHPKWRALREETKFARMLAFGGALPEIRKRVDQDLSLQGLPREKILATVVRLLEITLIRVGNEEYAKANHSYGLTTLRNRHVNISGGKLAFEFRGKSGKQHKIGLHDRRLATIVKGCKELPGAELFQYLDDHGQRHCIDSQDVNEYLQEITGHDFSAKDFRTWAGSVCALDALIEYPPCTSESENKRTIVAVVKNVAERLGNTPAVCRKHYIHPLVLESFMRQRLQTLCGKLPSGRDSVRAEHAMMALLRSASQ